MCDDQSKIVSINLKEKRVKGYERKTHVPTRLSQDVEKKKQVVLDFKVCPDITLSPHMSFINNSEN